MLGLTWVLACAALPLRAEGVRRLLLAEEMPRWQAVARLESGGGSYCTATLISDHEAVTAAHCVFDRALGTTRSPLLYRLVFGPKGEVGAITRSLRAIAVLPGYGVEDGGQAIAGAGQAGTQKTGTQKAGTQKTGVGEPGAAGVVASDVGADDAGSGKAGAEPGGNETGAAGTGAAGTGKAGNGKAGTGKAGNGKAGTEEAGTEGADGPTRTLARDLALLVLATPISSDEVTPMAVVDWPLPVGDFTDIMGYERDQPEVATLREGCMALESGHGVSTLACAVTGGNSGAPVLLSADPDQPPQMVAVVSARGGAPGNPRAYVVTLAPHLAELRALVAQAGGE